ncbi:hypothetical protein K5X82_04355 [Halosquirtibacter xylanolyticus]|uniref:hypothetical protein n=1 Tax=Halosquirtibacter xylanolyticus TaxID=3374599 RepID=UPI00374806BD|nr:hypothetical protein K5X82_04355 [Prolixibacteraceae bacterium]
MKIRVKIFAGFFIMAILMIAAGAISGIEFSKIGISINRILGENYKNIEASNQMLVGLDKQNNGILLILQGQWNEGYEEVEDGANIFIKGYNVVKNDTLDVVEKSSIESLGRHLSALNMMKDSTLFNHQTATIDWYYSKPYRLLTLMRHEVKKVQKINQDALYTTSTNLKERARRAIIPGIVVVVALLLFIAIFSYLVNHFFVKPLLHIKDRASDSLKYGRPFDVNIQTDDELKNLADVIKKLTNKNQ